MESLTVTITDHRIIDGFVMAANRIGMTPEALAETALANQGEKYAKTEGLGFITASSFISRFTASEYGAILTAAETNEQIEALVNELKAATLIAHNDPRLLDGLQALEDAELLTPERHAELLVFERPEPAVT